MPNFKNLFIYSVLILFLFLIPLVLFAGFSPSKVSAFTFFGNVLGDDDEDEGKNEDEKEDEDKDEDKEDEEDEKDRKDDKGKDENEDEDKDDDEEEKETRTATVNKDGTRTVTKKKVEDNGKVEIETKTYDPNGKVIEEYKSKDEDGDKEIEYEAKLFSEDGGKISEMKFKSKSGEELRLMIKNEDKSITKVKYDENHNYIRIIGRPQENESEEDTTEDTPDDDVLIRSIDDDTYELEHLGRKAHIELPLTVDDSDGSILLLTSEGERSLNNLPDVILKDVEASDDSTEVSDIEITERNGKIVYELSAEKAQKIFGLFETRIDTLITYDAETGQEIESVQSFWGKILDAVSF